MNKTYEPSHKTLVDVHADLYPFELHSPKLVIFGLRITRVVGIYVSGLTRVCNPYTTTLTFGKFW